SACAGDPINWRNSPMSTILRLVLVSIGGLLLLLAGCEQSHVPSVQATDNDALSVQRLKLFDDDWHNHPDAILAFEQKLDGMITNEDAVILAETYRRLFNLARTGDLTQFAAPDRFA